MSELLPTTREEAWEDTVTRRATAASREVMDLLRVYHGEGYDAGLRRAAEIADDHDRVCGDYIHACGWDIRLAISAECSEGSKP